LILYDADPGHDPQLKTWSVEEMLLNSLIAMTDNRKRMAILTLLTFAVLC
jgi:hypothetical protein